MEATPESAGGSVKIRLESHDEKLGWYTSASLTLALHQLAVLEQAIEHMRASGRSTVESDEKIILFPGYQPQIS